VEKVFYFYLIVKSHIKLLLVFVCLAFAKNFKSQTPTWAEHIAPILYGNCTSCHHLGGLAPNPLMTYGEAFNNRYLMKAYIESGYMPPWPPDPGYKHLAHERVISAADKDKISQWVLGGAPEGNSANAPAQPLYAGSNSALSTIDFSAKMQNYVVNTANDLYRCFIINTNFSTDRFASEIEVRPGNPAIVHHVLLYEDTTNLIRLKDSADAGIGYTSFFGTGSNDSKLVGEWVPGTQHIKFPAGMGARLRKNTRLVLQIHYPKGTYLKLDSTRVNIKFATNTSSPFFREVFMLPAISEPNLVNGPLVIPPNMVKTFTANSLAATNLPLPFPYFTLLSVAPHMHLIGKSMKVFAIDNSPTIDTIPLINIPNWDFKWQGVYNFRNPIKVAIGSKLVAHSAYDNTSNNLSNPSNPPVTVHQGEATTDEMMLVFFAFTAYLPGDENIVVDNSPIVSINDLQQNIVNSAQLYNVFPNPAKTSAQVNYFSPKTLNQVKASITAVNGKVVKEWSTTLQQGYGTVQLNLEGLARGQYFISLQTPSFTKTKPFIVYE
jgi:hypothetical protein